MRSLLRRSLDTAELRADGWHDVGGGPGSSEGDFIDWLTIVYGVKNGRLVEVPKATRAGQTR
jgi:carbonic anhydrase